LLLDNCEHLLDAVTTLARRILASAPAVRILATSREPLRTPHERTWRVPTLPAPDPDGVQDPAELLSYASVRLFVERAQAGFAADLPCASLRERPDERVWRGSGSDGTRGTCSGCCGVRQVRRAATASAA
jgi:hypothetical protein